MTSFEIVYIIRITMAGLTEVIALFTSIQFGVFAVIYLLRDVRDQLVRHAMMFLYSLTWGFSAARVLMDLVLIKQYSAILAETLKRESNRESAFSGDIFYAFITVFIVVFLSLWAATFYFLYFHKFSNNQETKT